MNGLRFGPAMSALVMLVALLAETPTARAADEWQKIAEGQIGKLFVQKSSIHTQGDGIALLYRVDFPEAQTNPKTGKSYASIQVGSTIFCATRTIVQGDLTAYAGKGGTGEVVGSQKISVIQARPKPIEPGTSDDDLRRFVCDNKSARRKP
jgi:hypothetical protein